jgi:hypothetical protein
MRIKQQMKDAIEGNWYYTKATEEEVRAEVPKHFSVELKRSERVTGEFGYVGCYFRLLK